MKRTFLALLLLSTLVLVACQGQSVQQNPPDKNTPQTTSQVANTGKQTASQQVISETQQSQETKKSPLNVEGVKIDSADKPIEVDLSQVYDATAHRDPSETQAVKP